MNVYITLIDHVDTETYYDDADTFFPLNYLNFFRIVCHFVMTGAYGVFISHIRSAITILI